MAITINGKEYDENDLSDDVKNSILQVQNSNQQIAQLQAEVLNHQIIAKHHSQNIQDNLPAEEEEAPTEEATAAKAPHPDTLVTE
mgnify:FL=1